jgi:hypothetical protein
VIGDPISHSRSPLIHRHWLETAGISGSYDPVHIRESELERFVVALKDGTSGFAGGNVTLPHKQAIADLVDDIDETARQIGAVNTVWLEAGRLCAQPTPIRLDSRQTSMTWHPAGIVARPLWCSEPVAPAAPSFMRLRPAVLPRSGSSIVHLIARRNCQIALVKGSLRTIWVS